MRWMISMNIWLRDGSSTLTKSRRKEGRPMPEIHRNEFGRLNHAAGIAYSLQPIGQLPINRSAMAGNLAKRKRCQ